MQRSTRFAEEARPLETFLPGPPAIASALNRPRDFIARNSYFFLGSPPFSSDHR